MLDCKSCGGESTVEVYTLTRPNITNPPTVDTVTKYRCGKCRSNGYL